MHDLEKVLSTSFKDHPDPDTATNDALEFLHNEAAVLVVGAGGLGCEILKCLAMSSFRRITVIDMDTIDVSNLNRQFLFSSADVGRPKAEVAASFINRRCAHLGVTVESKVCKIQDLDVSFYSQFTMIIAGLDNISARRWLNSVMFDLVRYHNGGEVDKSSLKFFLDGGTEGLKGQARVIIPTITACFECTIGTFPPLTTYPLCTIAETPRLPEHCVEYASTVMFARTHTSIRFDPDNLAHLTWVFEQASRRADIFGISGVTFSFTKGVVKRIIPAVASTNALIAGVLVNEAFKIATYAERVMDNYFMYMGEAGINGLTIAYEKNPTCLVCSRSVCEIKMEEDMILSELLEKIKIKLSLEAPSVVFNGRIVFMQTPPTLRAQFESRLKQPLSELGIHANSELCLTDPALNGRHVFIIVT